MVKMKIGKLRPGISQILVPIGRRSIACIRLRDPRVVGEASELFAGALVHCQRITLVEWKRSRTFLDRFKCRVARLIVGRLDSFFASRQLRWWKLQWSKVSQAKRHKPLDQEV